MRASAAHQYTRSVNWNPQRLPSDPDLRNEICKPRETSTPHYCFPPPSRAPADNGIAVGDDDEASIGKAIEGLPPTAILAGSHGGRLVASGIVISGDRGGGGFNVKAAKTAAKTALRQVALAQELATEEERNKATRDRAGPRMRAKNFSGGSRERRQVPSGSRRYGDGGASSWGWGQQRNSRKAATTFGRTSRTANRGVIGASACGGSAQGVGYSNTGGPLAPSFEGSVYSGSGGSVGGARAGTDASESVGSTGNEVVGAAGAATAQHLRELNEDSVMWASSRRGSSRSSSCLRNRTRRKEGGEGQVETIRRLVHMGLF